MDATNAELLGGAMAKRPGSALVNGLTGRCVAGSAGTTLNVVSSAGVVNGDIIVIWDTPENADWTPTVQTRTVNGTGAGTISVSVALAFSPAANAPWLIQHAFAGRVNGLFQVNFRSGSSFLVAAAAGAIWQVLATPLSFPEQFPQTTVDVNWGTGAGGTLTSVQGLQVGDWIQVFRGPGNLVARVVTLVPSTRAITVSPAFGTAPQAGDTVIFMPPRQPSDTNFAQYQNAAHIAQVQPTGAPITVAPIPPTKLMTLNPGLDIYRHGIKPPVTAPTVGVQAPAGAGITGTYTYRVKFRCSTTGQESEPSPISAPVSPAAQDVLVSAMPVSVDPQVDKKRIYRTTNGGAGVWFFIGEVTNATTTFVDGTTDAALSSSQMREFLDVTIPDTVSVIAAWTQANRLVAIDGVGRRIDPASGLEELVGGYVRFSDQPDSATGFLKGESWPADNTIFVGYDDGDALVGIVPFFDQLMVVKQRSIWRVVGIPPNLTIEPVVFRNDQTGVGGFNQKSIVMGENELMFPFQDGIYLVDRYMGVQSGLQSRLVSREIDDLYASLQAANAVKAHGVYFRQRRQLLLWVPRTSPVTFTAENLGRAFAYQMDVAANEEALGWTEHLHSGYGGTPTGDVCDVTASCIGRTGTADACFIGDAFGNVHQLFAQEPSQQGDWGFLPVGLRWEMAFTALAGPGVPVRARAIDLFTAGSLTNTTIMSPASDLTVTVVAAVGLPGVSFGPVVDDVQLQTALNIPGAGKEQRFVLLTRGPRLTILLQDFGSLTGQRVKELRLWWQALPVAALPVTAPPAGPPLVNYTGV